MAKQKYDHIDARKLEQYVRRNYANQLSNGALSFYLLAFPELEQRGLGLCQPITAAYPTLAKAGFKHPSRLRPVLNELAGVLCEVEIGTAISNGKKATMLRRYTLAELKTGELRRRLVDFTPPDAKALTEILNSRDFIYGDTPCRPLWNVLQTGRVQSSQPNVQNDPETKRVKNLCLGLQPGQVLISADYKAAEPSIIQHEIGYSFDGELYERAAGLLEISRDEAKKKINSLAYHRNSIQMLGWWNCPPAEKEFSPYAKALQDHKEKLWTVGKPKNNKRRFVNTVTGRKIEANRAEPPHRGQILNWRIQGTVADITNAACLKIIERESSEGWQFCFPVHDSAYVIGTPEQAPEIGAILQREADALKVPLRVRTDIYERDVICKSK